jgi:hypothetical protein
MKKYLALPLLAVFAATPVFAQMTNDGPSPGINTPGAGAEQRDDNVWRGAEGAADVESDSGIFSGDNDVAIGSDAAIEGDLQTGRSSTRDLPPNRALPGSSSEQRDENVWYGGMQPLD